VIVVFLLSISVVCIQKTDDGFYSYSIVDGCQILCPLYAISNPIKQSKFNGLMVGEDTPSFTVIYQMIACINGQTPTTTSPLSSGHGNCEHCRQAMETATTVFESVDECFGVFVISVGHYCKKLY
jgi:hypothetical protein